MMKWSSQQLATPANTGSFQILVPGHNIWSKYKINQTPCIVNLVPGYCVMIDWHYRCFQHWTGLPALQTNESKSDDSIIQLLPTLAVTENFRNAVPEKSDQFELKPVTS